MLFKENDKVVSAGLDMQCNVVLTKSTFVKYLDNPSSYYNVEKGKFTVLDCIVKNGGVNVMDNSKLLTLDRL